MLNCKFSQFW